MKAEGRRDDPTKTSRRCCGIFDERILEIGNEEAQVWGRLRVPYHENAIDKQIAATALTHDLILVTRNVDHFKDLGVRVFNPFD